MSVTALKQTNRGSSSPSLQSILPAAIATVVMVMFLFYIDEGYYDFRWMRNAGNWLMFVVYLAFVFPMQWLLAGMLGRLAGKMRSVAVVTLLTLLADSLILGLIFFL
jgi:hypothetical protein